MTSDHVNRPKSQLEAGNRQIAPYSDADWMGLVPGDDIMDEYRFMKKQLFWAQLPREEQLRRIQVQMDWVAANNTEFGRYEDGTRPEDLIDDVAQGAIDLDDLVGCPKYDTAFKEWLK